MLCFIKLLKFKECDNGIKLASGTITQKNGPVIYHILIYDKEFITSQFPEKLKFFNKQVWDNWLTIWNTIYLNKHLILDTKRHF